MSNKLKKLKPRYTIKPKQCKGNVVPNVIMQHVMNKLEKEILNGTSDKKPKGITSAM